MSTLVRTSVNGACVISQVAVGMNHINPLIICISGSDFSPPGRKKLLSLLLFFWKKCEISSGNFMFIAPLSIPFTVRNLRACKII
jgi:hypothetical protein